MLDQQQLLLRQDVLQLVVQRAILCIFRCQLQLGQGVVGTARHSFDQDRRVLQLGSFELYTSSDGLGLGIDCLPERLITPQQELHRTLHGLFGQSNIHLGVFRTRDSIALILLLEMCVESIHDGVEGAGAVAIGNAGSEICVRQSSNRLV